MPATSTPAPPMSGNLRGALWMLVSVAGATGMTLAVRELTPELHTRMVAFLRSALGLPFLLPLLVHRGGAWLRVRRPGLHLARGALTAVALNLGFYALWKLPIATATMLFFLAPVFATVLAPALLGERVGPRRWAAVAAGFLGALLILRPGTGAVEIAMLGAVGSSFCFAVALLLGKLASDADGTDAVFAWTVLTTSVLTLPMALTEWELPAGWAMWAALALLVVCATARTYADIRAFAAGEASFVAPFSYLRLLTVGLAGWWLFAELPGVWEATGGGVIAAATLYIALRESQARRGVARSEAGP